MSELHYWVDKEAHKGYESDNDLIYILTPDEFIVVELDSDDGYRSRANEINQSDPQNKCDNVTLWAKLQVGECGQKHTIVYDKIKYRYEGRAKRSYGEECSWIVKAWREDKLVFEIGTSNVGDYYPSYFFHAEDNVADVNDWFEDEKIGEEDY